MAKTPVESVFRPTGPQEAFMRSSAKVRAYGGAMGGGKSRTMCEVIWDYALTYPGLTAVIARDKHTSIINSTKKTMLEQVIPPEIVAKSKTKASGGEDYIELWNGSTIHFVGMDDPYRWYSSEISIFALDEAQELLNEESDKVVRLISRLRQRCHSCIRAGEPDCDHMPHKAMLSFNPSNPDHWLRDWFLLGAEKTEYGWRKPELVLEDASEPIGDAEFVFALPTDNPYLSKDYLKTLRGFPEHLRRRYLEGKWEYIDGLCFFDLAAMKHYEDVCSETKPVANGVLVGDISEDIAFQLRRTRQKPKDPIRIKAGGGPLTVFKGPDRGKDGKQPHRYVIGVDSSSGRGADWTAMQVVDVDTFEQVAELQMKIPPHEAAEWAYRLGRVYCNATIVCEVTGGWGFAVDQKLRELHYPRPYTRRILDRLSKKFTDKLGFDTTQRTRGLILSALEESLRTQELGFYSMRALSELATFVWIDGKAQAQPGAHDDLVMALALAVFVTLELPRQVRRPVERPHVPQFSATGY